MDNSSYLIKLGSRILREFSNKKNGKLNGFGLKSIHLFTKLPQIICSCVTKNGNFCTLCFHPRKIASKVFARNKIAEYFNS